MPLSRPHANSLQLSIDPIQITSTWRPARPPTPRRATYPQPGTTSLTLAGPVDSEVPPIPSLSYWEPDTPSPMSPHNPFLSPALASPGSPKALASPLLPASPLSIFDLASTKSPSLLSHTSSPLIGPELSPHFLDPRMPPSPPTKGTTSPAADYKRRYSRTRSVVPHGDREKRRHESIRDMLAAAQEKVLREMKETREDKDMSGENKSMIQYYIEVKKRRERRNIIRKKSFRVLKPVEAKA